MKKLGTFNKFILFLNWIASLLLVVSFILPYLPPKSFPIVSLLSLGVSPLIVLNLLFFFYWLILVRKQLRLSAIVLVISYFHFNSFYAISSDLNTEDYNNSIKVLSYNVRLFNAYEKNNTLDTGEMMSKLLDTEQPDVLMLQEFHNPNTVDFSDFKYKYIHFRFPASQLGHAIFSKYKIINTAAFNFENTTNNVLYADVIKGRDTIRIYNLHLQSLKIIPENIVEGKENEKLWLKRISKAFQTQEEQIAKLIEHKDKSPYPVILGGDFNNTPFSYTYQKLHQDMKDGFIKRGNGLGSTFLFNKYPMRIDFLFADKDLDFIHFENIKKTFSDHYPISATIGWDKKEK